jgi:hypothetical protein
MKKLALIAITAGILSASGSPALATSVDLGTIQPGTTDGYVFSHAKGSFTDTINFMISQGGGATAQYFNFLVTGKKGDLRSNITNAFLSVTGPSSFSTSLKHDTSYDFSVKPGAYSATVTGVANGALGGAYAVQVAAPTPEPEAMGMIAVGMGMAAGYVGRRRKKTSSVQA